MAGAGSGREGDSVWSPPDSGLPGSTKGLSNTAPHSPPRLAPAPAHTSPSCPHSSSLILQGPTGPEGAGDGEAEEGQGRGGFQMPTAKPPGPRLTPPVVSPTVIRSHRTPPAASLGSDLVLPHVLCGLGQITEALWASVSP